MIAVCFCISSELRGRESLKKITKIQSSHFCLSVKLEVFSKVLRGFYVRKALSYKEMQCQGSEHSALSQGLQKPFCCITRCPALQSFWKNKDLSSIPFPLRETPFFFFLQALTKHSMAQSQKTNFPGQKPHPQVKT